MILESTKGQVAPVNFEEAIFKGLPEDNGLFLPTSIPTLEHSFFDQITDLSFTEIAQAVTRKLLSDEITVSDIDNLVRAAMNFEVPLVNVGDSNYCLELFHGPSLAFKDFGARFMAHMMSYFLQRRQQEINILVATSGDTGSAVAHGFFDTPGVKVTILYPSCKVSPLQEKQLTTLGRNITAIEIDGVFDDCQRLVKEAFLDKDLQTSLSLSSANSINIARLIPQSFYYFEAYARLKDNKLPIVFCTPSGNYGNLCGGVIAARMGLPVHQFIAASNSNDIVPHYLQTGEFHPKPSVATISNAMDVGNPSNFPRLLALYHHDYQYMINHMVGCCVTDDETRLAMQHAYKHHDYVMCPHTAVAYEAVARYREKNESPFQSVFLGTAHPAKFIEIVEETLSIEMPLPPMLLAIKDKQKESIRMGKEFDTFKQYLLDTK
jgi:threonine synthase